MRNNVLVGLLSMVLISPTVLAEPGVTLDPGSNLNWIGHDGGFTNPVTPPVIPPVSDVGSILPPIDDPVVEIETPTTEVPVVEIPTTVPIVFQPPVTIQQPTIESAPVTTEVQPDTSGTATAQVVQTGPVNTTVNITSNGPTATGGVSGGAGTFEVYTAMIQTGGTTGGSDSDLVASNTSGSFSYGSQFISTAELFAPTVVVQDTIKGEQLADNTGVPTPAQQIGEPVIMGGYTPISEHWGEFAKVDKALVAQELSKVSTKPANELIVSSNIDNVPIIALIVFGFISILLLILTFLYLNKRSVPVQ